MENPYTQFFKGLLGAAALAFTITLLFTLLIVFCALAAVVVIALMIVCLPFVPFISFGVAAYEVGMLNTFFKGIR